MVVLDDGPVAGGMTERTTAHLSNVIDDGYMTIERLHGEQGARLVADSHTAAINRIETIIAAEHLACDFERVDRKVVNPNDGGKAGAKSRQPFFFQSFQLLTGLRKEKAIEEPGGCLLFPSQAQFHPLKFMAGIAQAIERCGGHIFPNTHVETVKAGKRVRIETRQGHIIHAQSVVVATNTPINEMVVVHTKQASYTTEPMDGPALIGRNPGDASNVYVATGDSGMG